MLFFAGTLNVVHCSTYKLRLCSTVFEHCNVTKCAVNFQAGFSLGTFLVSSLFQELGASQHRSRHPRESEEAKFCAQSASWNPLSLIFCERRAVLYCRLCGSRCGRSVRRRCTRARRTLRTWCSTRGRATSTGPRPSASRWRISTAPTTRCVTHGNGVI